MGPVAVGSETTMDRDDRFCTPYLDDEGEVNDVAFLEPKAAALGCQLQIMEEKENRVNMCEYCVLYANE
jgi:hypothetical protein